MFSKSANEQVRKLWQNITKLVSFILKTKVNEEILKICYGVNLDAITKKDGELEILYTQ